MENTNDRLCRLFTSGSKGVPHAVQPQEVATGENFAKQHLMGLQCAAAKFPLGQTGDANTSPWFHSGDAQRCSSL
ncbi:hypothetical protein E2562_037726 [Oryza meyeriana var. granulata]|uniref:Uncharacterized protein n=1 Tax=Oryza meyeriana var. granulata TaxID=110450 RepID=A0A6G1ETT8_9ORYZ|nr:hypothetical protein E2562_037726 [Oryza meyeriana var. granulata]